MFWQIRLLLILLAAVELSFSQNSSPALQINPAAPQQGDTLRISSSRPATHARLGDRRIQLFAQTDNTLLGLMPIAANHRPGQFPIEILDSKGAVLTTQTVVIRKANFLEQNVQLTQTLQELKAAPGDAEAMRQFHAILSTDRNWFEPLSSPVPGCVVSPYGVQRLHNGKPTGNYHSGIDQRGAAGTPVRAAAAGTVRLVKPLALGGNTVGVDHGQGLLSSYSHLSRFALQDGATIQKADIIGYVGSTGRSTAPHLHWTLMANGVGVNPAQWIPFTPCAVAPKPKPKKRRRS